MRLIRESRLPLKHNGHAWRERPCLCWSYVKHLWLLSWFRTIAVHSGIWVLEILIVSSFPASPLCRGLAALTWETWFQCCWDADRRPFLASARKLWSWQAGPRLSLFKNAESNRWSRQNAADGKQIFIPDVRNAEHAKRPWNLQSNQQVHIWSDQGCIMLETLKNSLWWTFKVSE